MGQPSEQRERNAAIVRRYLEGENQIDLACEYGLRQPRISAIVKKHREVQRKLGGHGATHQIRVFECWRHFLNVIIEGEGSRGLAPKQQDYSIRIRGCKEDELWLLAIR